MAADTPSDTDLIQKAIRAQLARVHTALPGVVQSYDPDSQTATVQPAVQFKARDKDGAITDYEAPAIPNVPVAFPGAGDFSIVWLLEAGDTVLLVFCERSLDEWRSTAGSSHAARDVRRHDLSDAVAIPALRSPAAPVGAEGLAAGALVVRGAEVRLGSSAATSYVALATLVDAALQQLATAFSGWTPVPADGGAALKTILTALLGTGWPASTAAAKVKAE